MMLVSVPHTGTRYTLKLLDPKHRTRFRVQNKYSEVDEYEPDVLYWNHVGPHMKALHDCAKKADVIVIPLRDPLLVELSHNVRKEKHDLRWWDMLDEFRQYDPEFLPVDYSTDPPDNSWGEYSEKRAYHRKCIDCLGITQDRVRDLGDIAKRFSFYDDKWWLRFANR